MGLLDKVGVFGIIPFPQDLLGQGVDFLADQDEHLFGTRVDELQGLFLLFKGMHLFIG
jgi:hypothetical protein